MQSKGYLLIFSTAMLLLTLISGTGRCEENICFELAGTKYGISARLLKAIARAESGLDPTAINQNRDGSYDYGLMQINSRWSDVLRENWVYITDPCYNIMVGAWVLRQCMERYGYTWDAIACYNTGKSLSDLKGKRKKHAHSYIQRVREYLILTGTKQ